MDRRAMALVGDSWIAEMLRKNGIWHHRDVRVILFFSFNCVRELFGFHGDLLAGILSSGSKRRLNLGQIDIEVGVDGVPLVQIFACWLRRSNRDKIRELFAVPKHLSFAEFIELLGSHARVIVSLHCVTLIHLVYWIERSIYFIHFKQCVIANSRLQFKWSIQILILQISVYPFIILFLMVAEKLDILWACGGRENKEFL